MIYFSLARTVWLILIIASTTITASFAYRIGDAIDTDVRLDATTTDALRSQMPTFGVNGRVRFDSIGESKTFALMFEDGLYAVPTIPLINGAGEFLSSWEVLFTYDSSQGSIDTVSYGQPMYAADSDETEFIIEYKWVQEQALRVTAGQNAMFIIVLVASLYFLWISYSSDSIDGFGGQNGMHVPKRE
jgi:hypothetical protein